MSSVKFNTHCADDLFPFLNFTDEDDAPLEVRFASLQTRLTHCHELSEQLYRVFGELAQRGDSARLVKKGDALAYALVNILSELPQEATDIEMMVQRVKKRECQE